MEIHNVNFNQFISNTFDEIQLNAKEEDRILTVHKWKSIHHDSYLYEITRVSENKWMLRLTIWKIGEDTFRIKDVMERIKWIGKEFKPTFIIQEQLLTESEAQGFRIRILELDTNSQTTYNFHDKYAFRIIKNETELQYSWNDITIASLTFQNLMSYLEKIISSSKNETST